MAGDDAVWGVQIEIQGERGNLRISRIRNPQSETAGHRAICAGKNFVVEVSAGTGVLEVEKIVAAKRGQERKIHGKAAVKDNGVARVIGGAIRAP